MRSRWFVAGIGFVAGVAVCLIGAIVLEADFRRYKTLTEPVAIVPAGAEKRGYVGAEFSNEPSRSLYVAGVTRPGPDDSDRPRAGDLVTSVGGRTVTSFAEYQATVAGSKPGETIDIGVVRDGQPMTLHVRLMSLSEMLSRREGGTR